MSAADIKVLRERTGLGFMACKKALEESDGNLDAAVDYLRKSSGVKADGKSARETSEGVISLQVAPDQSRGVLLEINCETDFVARSDDFQTFVANLAQTALQADAAEVSQLPEQPEIEQTRAELVQKLGENIRIRRIEVLPGDSGCRIGGYLHSNHKMGALVVMVGEGVELANQIAMHVAAESPLVVSAEEVPAEVLERERAVYVAQADEMNKPPEMRDKIVAGRLKKFCAGISLLEQDYVRDPDIKVGALLEREGSSVTSILRFELGEAAKA